MWLKKECKHKISNELKQKCCVVLSQKDLFRIASRHAHAATKQMPSEMEKQKQKKKRVRKRTEFGLTDWMRIISSFSSLLKWDDLISFNENEVFPMDEITMYEWNGICMNYACVIVIQFAADCAQETAIVVGGANCGRTQFISQWIALAIHSAERRLVISFQHSIIKQDVNEIWVLSLGAFFHLLHNQLKMRNANITAIWRILIFTWCFGP